MEIKVICGAVIFKDGKFVLVKEAQKHCYGKWNLPAGHLDLNESLFNAAIREVKEETNLDVKLEGLIGIYQNNSIQGHNVVKIIFSASVIKGTLKHDEKELLDARWFSFKEFSKLTDSEIRTLDLKKIIKDFKDKRIEKLDFINSIGF